MIAKKLFCFLCLSILILSISCSSSDNKKQQTKSNQKELLALLNTDMTEESRFTVLYQIANNYIAENKHDELVLFLTDYVEKHPNDKFNPYWLLMVAYSYMERGALPIAEYYFDRILNNYDDLIVKDTSIHYTCLKNLVKITKSSDSKIAFYTQLISRFPDDVSLTELYARLAVEYEAQGDWEQTMKYYSLFRYQADATTIQISDIPNIYTRACQITDFNASAKNWSFETLSALETAVKNAIRSKNFRLLDTYKSKVNFFAMSWQQDANDVNTQKNFSMTSVMSSMVRCSNNVDDSSNPSEAFLRTWGWPQNVSVWYFYFRKINFPLDPDVHGRWEWAGIYFGEKL